MEGNKDESAKCISIALHCMESGNTDKARKFLLKAQKLYPSKKATELLNKLEPSTVNGDAHNGDSIHHRQRKHSHSKAQNNSTERDIKHHADYTKEQLSAVKRINSCKDVYEVLELSKEFIDVDLKKAYRRLALMMHPDKNKAPGATEAFKAVGKAYSILSDNEKRKQYDLYGPEMQPSRLSKGHDDCSHSYEGDISPEELFNMFFGGGFPTGNINRRQHHQTRRTFNTSQRPESGLTLFFQLAPILLLIAMSILSSFFVSDPVFSLHKTEKYRVEKTTTNLRIPYYVKGDFRVEFAHDLRRIENAVEEEYIGQLRNNCFRERNYKDNMIWRARSYGDAKLYQKAMDLATPSCDNLHKVYP